MTVDTVAATPLLWIGKVAYDSATRLWLQRSDHYLNNAPPGCLFAVGVYTAQPMLFSEIPVPVGELLGLCLVGRPIARKLPQDGSFGEITRLFLIGGLPHGTASRVLRRSAEIAKDYGMKTLISYHDRTRHTGCIYRKAGFKKDGVTVPNATGWKSRNRPNSQDVGSTSKRRWRMELQ